MPSVEASFGRGHDQRGGRGSEDARPVYREAADASRQLNGVRGRGRSRGVTGIPAARQPARWGGGHVEPPGATTCPRLRVLCIGSDEDGDAAPRSTI